MIRRVLRSQAARRLAGWVIGSYLALALRTTRWTIQAPAESWPYMTGVDGRTAIIAFWHEFLPLAPALWLHARGINPRLRMNVLVSRHRDGRMITDIIGRWNVSAVAGSGGAAKTNAGSMGAGRTGAGKVGGRDKGGVAAVRQILDLLSQGSLVAITPDGPRGPRRTLQPGLARLAALSGVPVIAFAAATGNGRRLGSWDRMILPLPFGRGHIACAAPVFVSAQAWQSGQDQIAATLEGLVRTVGA